MFKQHGDLNFNYLKSIIILFLVLITFGCGNSETSLYFDHFAWQLTLPSELVETDKKATKKSQEKGLKMIEETYNEKFKVSAIELFNYQYKDHKYNNIKAQFKKLDSPNEFLEEHNRATEIVVRTFKNQKPNTKIETINSSKMIDGLEFKYFELKIPASDGLTTHLLTLSRLFDNRKLDILIVYQDDEKGEMLLNAALNSKFD
jgi:hypothetical protein